MSSRATDRALGRSGIGAHHVPRRVADHRVEPGRRGRRRRVRVEEHFRKLELPVKEASRRRRSRPRRRGSARRCCRGSAPRPGERRVGQRRERRRRRRIAVGRRTTRRTRDRRPASSATAPRRARSARRARAPSPAPARACRSERLEREADRQHRRAARRRRRSSSNSGSASRRRRAASRRPADWRTLRSHAPSRLSPTCETMVEKRQRPIGGERRQPERQPRQLHRHRVQIDAVEAPLGDRAPNRRSLVLADVARMAAAASNSAVSYACAR